MAAGYAKIKEDFDAGHLLSDSQKAQLRSLAAQNFDPNQGSARELSCASVSRLRDARSEEREGRQKVASMRRMLQDARVLADSEQAAAIALPVMPPRALPPAGEA